MTDVTVRFAHAIDGYDINDVVTLPGSVGYRYINSGYAVRATGESPTLPGDGGGTGINPSPVNPTGKYLRGDVTWQNLDKSAVGLSNVNNTSDADKPVSMATASAIASITITPPPVNTFENAL